MPAPTSIPRARRRRATSPSQTTTFLAIFRGIQANTAPGPGDADVKTVFDSIKVTQNGDRAEILATIPPAFLRKLVDEPAHNAVQRETTPSRLHAG